MSIILAFIITVLPSGITKLTATEGKALCRADETGPTRITEVYLSKSDKIENWKDCEYGDKEPIASAKSVKK